MNMPVVHRLAAEGEQVTRDEYNDGYTHEVLHLASTFEEIWSRHVLDTRCADEFPDVKDAATKIADAIGDFYQLVGGKFSDER